jgi:hypothetical protein
MADADFARALLRMAVEGREIDGTGVRLVGRRIEGPACRRSTSRR